MHSLAALRRLNLRKTKLSRFPKPNSRTLHTCYDWPATPNFATTRLLTAVAVFLFQIGFNAREAAAGTIRDDVSDSEYLTLASNPALASVGKITIGSSTFSGVLIDDRWVLTTAHITSAVNPVITVNLGGLSYAASEWIPHSMWTTSVAGINGNDIALIRLSTPVTGVAPATIYSGSNELGSTATIAGFGLTGTGLTGPAPSTASFRAGQNVLDVPGSVLGRSDNYLLADFDNPSSTASSSFGSATPSPLEYMPATGDDGGGAFINDGGMLKLAGLFAFGLKGPVRQPGSTSLGRYGDLMAFTRVSAFGNWILDQMSVHHWMNPSGGVITASGNWEEGTAPSATDLAVFNTAGSYAVNFTGDFANKAILVRTGNVTLNLAGHNYTLSTTTADGSIVVGQRSGDVAKLSFVGGTSTAIDASIGAVSGSTGQLNVSGPGTVLNLSGSLGVGGSLAGGGTGTLLVDNGASVQIAGKLSIWESGTATFNGGPTTVGSFGLSHGGLITGSGNLTVTGSGSTFTGGTIHGTGSLTIAQGATLTIGDSSSLSKDLARTLVNAGTINWVGPGQISGSEINNQSGAIFNAQGDGSLFSITFNNAGLFKKSAGTGSTTTNLYFNNTGVVQVQSGTLNLNYGGVQSGTFDIAAGATLNFGGGTHSFSAASAITGGGTAMLGGATLVFAGDNSLDNWLWTAGSISGAEQPRSPKVMC